MNSPLRPVRSLIFFPARHAAIVLAMALTGCRVYNPTVEKVPNVDFRREVADTNRVAATAPKKLLVFLDGTRNKWDSKTNVRRLFELASAQQDPQLACLYVDGVGASSWTLLGSGLGFSMKPRILAGYEFLSENWRPGDEIYIFGFSRGSHEARALTGVISHCGLMDDSLQGRRAHSAAKDVWRFCRKQKDVTDPQAWKNVIASQAPPLAEGLRTKYNLINHYADITFLGVFDTVPGSLLKSFDWDQERPREDEDKGIRYKMQAYPPIQQIAHALSLDEHRRTFRPVLFGTPIDPQRTKLDQVWFAGAHSDVGGGYEDSNDLAGIPLNWMLARLDGHKIFRGETPSVYGNALGLQHDTANTGLLWRVLSWEDRWRPDDAKIDPSVSSRTNHSVLVRDHTGYHAEVYSLKQPAPPYKKN